jgi:hypothetical protein
MDAATRDELDALRRRAYGPHPDIAADPEALERLAELEDLALPAVQAPAEAAPVVAQNIGAPAAASAAGRSGGAAVAPAPAPPAAPGGRRWALPLVGAAAVVAVALAVAGVLQDQRPAPDSAAQPTPSSTGVPAGGLVVDPDAQMLVSLMIDASTGDFVDVSDGADIPVFPVGDEMTWVQPLGEYYGWALWIGGAPSVIGDQNCLLLHTEPATWSSCVTREAKTEGALVVTLPYDQIAPEERPAGMTPDQRISFVWGDGGFITILLTSGG